MSHENVHKLYALDFAAEWPLTGIKGLIFLNYRNQLVAAHWSTIDTWCLDANSCLSAMTELSLKKSLTGLITLRIFEQLSQMCRLRNTKSNHTHANCGVFHSRFMSKFKKVIIFTQRLRETKLDLKFELRWLKPNRSRLVFSEQTSGRKKLRNFGPLSSR